MVAKDFISMQNTIKKYLLKDISREELAGIVSVINNHNSTYFEEEICYPMGEFDDYTMGMSKEELKEVTNKFFNKKEDLFNVDEYGCFHSCNKKDYYEFLVTMIDEIVMAVIDNKTNDYPPMLLKIIDVYENH
jgi:hypothetical protein